MISSERYPLRVVCSTTDRSPLYFPQARPTTLLSSAAMPWCTWRNWALLLFVVLLTSGSGCPRSVAAGGFLSDVGFEAAKAFADGLKAAADRFLDATKQVGHSTPASAKMSTPAGSR
jgi:hypothetical protein